MRPGRLHRHGAAALSEAGPGARQAPSRTSRVVRSDRGQLKRLPRSIRSLQMDMSEVLQTRDGAEDLPLILIADDDKATRVLLRRVMEREGYKVVAAETGAEAVGLCQSVAADLILLDYIMPELDGVDACAQIRKLERYKTTPVLMITSLDDDASIQRAMVCGASDY